MCELFIKFKKTAKNFRFVCNIQAYDKRRRNMLAEISDTKKFQFREQLLKQIPTLPARFLLGGPGLLSVFFVKLQVK